MTTLAREKELVLATHNQGKVKEISKLLGEHFEKIYTAGELGLDDPEETETTFAGNAALKAKAAAKASGKMALSDDSGLSVSALGGAPGVYSARWAIDPETGQRDFGKAMEQVNLAVADFEDKTAAFICVLAVAWPGGKTETFEGRVEGHVIWPPRGDKGFGYDPMFVPKGHQQTFAEMTPEQKHSMSHRSMAFRKLKQSGLFEI